MLPLAPNGISFQGSIFRGSSFQTISLSEKLLRLALAHFSFVSSNVHAPLVLIPDLIFSVSVRKSGAEIFSVYGSSASCKYYFALITALQVCQLIYEYTIYYKEKDLKLRICKTPPEWFLLTWCGYLEEDSRLHCSPSSSKFL